MSESSVPPPVPASSSTKPKGKGSGCLIAIGVVVALAIIGKAGKDKEERDVAEAGQPGSAARVERVEITTLLSQYEDNEVRADGYFKGRIVEFSGIVDDVKKDILGSIFVTVGTGKRFEIPRAQCFFSDSHAASVSRLSGGSRITVRGRVEGLMMNVLVKDCILVQ